MVDPGLKMELLPPISGVYSTKQLKGSDSKLRLCLTSATTPILIDLQTSKQLFRQQPMQHSL